MARDRNQPQSWWTWDQFVELSEKCRLLYMGLGNFADDSGVHEANYKRVKMELYAADDKSLDDIMEHIKDLIKQNLITEYSVGDKKYWRILDWNQYQKVQYPSFKFPLENGSIPIPPPRDEKKKANKENNSNSENSEYDMSKSRVTHEYDKNNSPLNHESDNINSCRIEEKRREEKSKKKNIYKKSDPQILELTDTWLAWGKAQPENFTNAEMKKGLKIFNLIASTRDKPFVDLAAAFEIFMLADHGYLLRQRDKTGDDSAAEKAWETAIKEAKYTKKAILLADDKIQAAVKKIGGWSELGHATTFEIATVWRPKFIAAYREVSSK